MSNTERSDRSPDDRPIHKAPSVRVVDPRDRRRPRRSPGADRAFLDAHRAELAARYPDEFVAVVNGEFIDHGRDLFALGERINGTNGYNGALIWFTGPRRPRRTSDGNQVSP
jgi:hypothetical protein